MVNTERDPTVSEHSPAAAVISTHRKPVRFLIITRLPVHPQVGGAAMRNWQTVNLLGAIGTVATVSIVSPDSDAGDAPPSVEHWWTFCAADRSLLRKIRRHLWWLYPRGLAWVDVYYGKDVEQKLQAVFESYLPDVVVFEELWLHRYVSLAARTGCHLVYDAHNIETLLARGVYRGNTRSERVLAAIANRHIANMERHVVGKCDQVWVCSERDKQDLESELRRAHGVHVIPNGINLKRYSDSVAPPRRGGFTLIFTASFGYEPNSVAAGILIGQIFPRIREELPFARLLLVGAGATREMLAAAESEPDIVVTGRVDDVIDYLEEADVVVVPLLAGGGTRLKVLEAFASGKPVVSSAKGSEGIEAIDGVHLLVRDDVSEMVQAILDLARDRKLSDGLAKNARLLIQDSYSWTALMSRYERAVDEMMTAEDHS